MEYQESIRNFIVENFLFEDGSQLQDSDSLLQTGVIDSTGVLELIFFLEQRYQIAIAPAELTPENMDSVEKIARFVEQKSPGRQPLTVQPADDPAEGARQGVAADQR
jgi:acyl carrier protein